MTTTLTPELMRVIAARFKALGEPARLRILSALRESERTVGEIESLTGFLREHGYVSSLIGKLRRGFNPAEQRTRKPRDLFSDMTETDDHCSLACQIPRHVPAAHRLPVPFALRSDPAWKFPRKHEERRDRSVRDGLRGRAGRSRNAYAARHHFGVDRMIDADVENVQPAQRRRLAQSREELTRPIGKDIA